MDNKLQEITEYIHDMKIKRAFFGGYDREDVYIKFGEVVQMFQKYIEEVQEKEKEQIESYEQRIRTSEMLITELNKKIGNMAVQQKGIAQEKEKMRDVYKGYCTNILQQYSDSLRALSNEFSNILENVTTLQQSIVDIDLVGVFEEKIEALPEKEDTGLIQGQEEKVDC